MSNNKFSSSGGIGFVGLLTIVFIVLKLCGVIHWSWWWVLSPILISCAFTIAILGVAGVMLLLAAWLRSRETPGQKVARRCREISDMVRKQ